MKENRFLNHSVLDGLSSIVDAECCGLFGHNESGIFQLLEERSSVKSKIHSQFLARRPVR